MRCRNRSIVKRTFEQIVTSKKSTFVIFLTKKFVLSMIIRIFAASVPTKPLNDAQMRGAFLYIYVLLSKCANGKITALHETLHYRGRFGGSVEKSWAYHFR